MRVAAFALFAAVLLAGCAPSYRTLPADQQVVQQVHEVDLSKDRIYLGAQQWFAKNLGKSNEALQIQNQAEGLIVGHVIIPGGATDGLGIVSMDVKLAVKIEVKDKRYRATYDDFSLVMPAGASIDHRDPSPGAEFNSAKASAVKLDAQILAAIQGAAKEKDF